MSTNTERERERERESGEKNCKQKCSQGFRRFSTSLLRGKANNESDLILRSPESHIEILEKQIISKRHILDTFCIHFVSLTFFNCASFLFISFQYI